MDEAENKLLCCDILSHDAETIRADGYKMPIAILSKVKPIDLIPGCDPYECYIYQNESGWITEELIFGYLPLFLN